MLSIYYVYRCLLATWEEVKPKNARLNWLADMPSRYAFRFWTGVQAPSFFAWTNEIRNVRKESSQVVVDTYSLLLRTDSMMIEERRRAILEALRIEGCVLVAELGKRFRTSQVTIRKDLEILHATGRIHRTHDEKGRIVGTCKPTIGCVSSLESGIGSRSPRC
jgi:hypothetical protein